MKTLISTLSAALFTIVSSAQDKAPLTLTADAGIHGARQTVQEIGLQEELRTDLRGRVSGLQVATGYTAILFDGPDGDGRDSLRLVGPCRIEDLKTIVRLHGSGHWDNAIGSIALHVSARPELQVAAPELAVTE